MEYTGRSKTDRELLTEIHNSICSPVLFPQLEYTSSEDGPLASHDTSFIFPFHNVRVPSTYFYGEVFSFDSVSFKMRFRFDDLPATREFFFQIGRVKNYYSRHVNQ